MVGQVLSHYTILEKLGEGGMGVVYRAYDTVLQRPVAIKIPRDNSALREARNASSLNHPGICTIHEVIECDGETLIVMEYIEGELLHDAIPATGLPQDALMAWVTDIADAMAHAHQRGIVHRDLKSTNVIVTRDRRLKILDFGLARHRPASVLEASAFTTTVDGYAFVGTIPYMAPELFKGAAGDARSDVWAMGVLFYEMATGLLPFHGSTSHEIVAAILDRESISLPPFLSPALVDVIGRCLTKDPGLRYQTAGEVRAGVESRRSAARAVTSIAVLPFRDLSASRDQEYFCEGIAEELINALTTVEGLEVASRTSAFQFGTATVDLEEVARRLHVSAVLQGSVRASGNRLRVAAQLVNVANGFQIWSDRYDREMGDVFALQDDIARSILEKLKLKLVGDGVAKRQTFDPEAYHLYLRGRYYWTRRYRGFMARAIECFEQAIGRDPTYALAYAGLADCYTTLVIQGAVTPGVGSFKAKPAAERAIALGDHLAEAHTAMAFVRFFVDWNFAEAERECRAAIARNPAAGAPRGMLAAFLASRGRLDEALAEAGQAKQVEPLSTLVGYYVTFTKVFAGRFEDAIEEGAALIELDPHLAQSLFVLTIALSAAGRHPEATAAARQALELSHGWSRALMNFGAASAAAGQLDEARRILNELDALVQQGKASPIDLAFVLAQTGDTEAACDCLERACAEKHPLVMLAAVYPWLQPLHGHLRFQQTLQRIGL